MRYVEKGASPDFFEACKQSLPDNAVWKNFGGNKEGLGECKKNLRKHLISEQSGLCIYCERKIKLDISHVEHIYPKSNANYTHRAFDYTNLVASCNGDSCSAGARESYKPEDVQSCGHKKEDDIDESLFLNPVVCKEISSYFIYNKTTGAILPTEKDHSKASYTLDLLNLDNSCLNNERSKAREALINATKKFKGSELKRVVHLLLAKNPAFISFLRYNFSSILAHHP